MKHLMLYTLTSAIALSCCGNNDDVVDPHASENVQVPEVPAVAASNTLSEGNPHLSDYGNVVLSEDSVVVPEDSVFGTSHIQDCEGLTHLDLTEIPNGATHVSFANAEHLTSIGDFFLVGCKSITSIDLSAWKNVTTIGDFFLWRCASLTSIDLSPLTSLTNIGSDFLGECTALTSMDLSSLTNVRNIGDYSLLD